MNLLIVIIFVSIAIVIIILEYINTEPKNINKKQRQFKLGVLFLSIILLLGNALYDYYSSNIAKKEIKELYNSNQRLETKGDSLIYINLILNSKIDSLNFSNELLKSKLDNTQLSIDQLKHETKLGFEINREAINHLESFDNQRFLPEVQKNYLINELKNYQGDSIKIFYHDGSEEALNFASDFREVFSKSGWEIVGFGKVIYQEPYYGLKVKFTKGDDDKVSDIFNYFYKASGYKFNGYWFQEGARNVLELQVGLNPE